ncbi:MAG TPA: hypothetical protein VGD58_06305 [Herpetosiphonaceae bacterium]
MKKLQDFYKALTLPCSCFNEERHTLQMVKPRLIIPFLAIFLSFVCMFIVVVVAFVQGLFPAGHLGPIALAPQVAAADMLNNRGSIQDFHVQSVQPWKGNRLVVHHYTVVPPGQPARSEFGYALVELRRGGWSVFRAELDGSAAPPARISYVSTQLDQTLLVYGWTIDPQIKAVEITTTIGQSVRTIVENEGFAVLVPAAQQLQTLRALDARGQVLEQHDKPKATLPVP